jgi:biopolymer transport protein ExbB
MTPDAPTPHSLTAYLASGGITALLTATVLAVMSVATWYWIALGTWRVLALRGGARRTARALANSASLAHAAQAIGDQAVYGELVDAAAFAARQRAAVVARGSDGDEFVARALGQVIARVSLRLDRGLTVLATIGSTAPFVGLLGTVLGIYRALIAMGTQGNASLATVALPVGEALVMTAAGLAVALPAVMAYNALVRANRITRASLEDLGEELLRHVVADTPLGAASAPQGRAGARCAEQVA